MYVMLTVHNSRADVKPIEEQAMRLQALGGEVRGLEQNDTASTWKLSDGTSLRVEYLVGCAGGCRLIRKAAGIESPEVGSDDQPSDHRGRGGRGAGMRSTPRRARESFLEQHGVWESGVTLRHS
jgi:hypothetical protein